MEKATPLPRLRLPTSSSSSLLPNELMAAILSLLPIKQLIQLRCVNKYFNNFISDPYFIQIHLKKSSQNPNLAVIWRHNWENHDSSFVTLSIPILHPNHFTTFYDDNHYRLNDDFHIQRVIGSCNGLICLNCISYLCFWNPATRTKSESFSLFSESFCYQYKFSFGYDNLNETYKVVAFMVEIDIDCKCNPKSVVKVFTFGDKDKDKDNSWRDIQCFPVTPVYWFHGEKNNGVYLNGTINWLALQNYFCLHYDCSLFDDVTVEQYVIVSLDLSTESYTEIKLPSGFDKVPNVQPTVAVLMNSLCFSHDYERKDFVIWQMKDFGVQESWIQLFKISYQGLYSSNYNCVLEFQWSELLPLYLYENDYRLILAKNHTDPAFILHCRDDIVEPIRYTNKIWWLWAKDYIESLVPVS